MGLLVIFNIYLRRLEEKVRKCFLKVYGNRKTYY